MRRHKQCTQSTKASLNNYTIEPQLYKPGLYRFRGDTNFSVKLKTAPLACTADANQCLPRNILHEHTLPHRQEKKLPTRLQKTWQSCVGVVPWCEHAHPASASVDCQHCHQQPVVSSEIMHANFGGPNAPTCVFTFRLQVALVPHFLFFPLNVLCWYDCKSCKKRNKTLPYSKGISITIKHESQNFMVFIYHYKAPKSFPL